MDFNDAEKIQMKTLLQRQITKIKRKIRRGYGANSREAIEYELCIDIYKKLEEV